MKYKNTHPTSALDFELGKDKYEVPCGGLVEIPDHWAPWVVSRGLYLQPAPVVVAEPAQESAPTPAVEEEPKQKSKPKKG